MSTNNPSLVVQRLDRATDIASSSGLPYKCLVFPVTGGVQAIDAVGTVLPLVGATGSLIPTPDDTDSLGSAALRWRAGYFGTSVQTPLLNTQVGGLATSVMALAAAASAVNIVTVTSAAPSGIPSIAATGNDPDISLTIDTKGTGSLLLTAPAQINPPAAASGVQTALTINAATNAAVTSKTEQIDVDIYLNRIVTWAAGEGPLGVQRAVSIAAPTYVGSVAIPLVISDATTVYISGAPIDGADLSITRNHALWIAGGLARFDGGIGATGANTGEVTCLNVHRAVNLAAAGANDIAATMLFTVQNAANASSTAAFLTATMTNATTGASRLALGGAFGGASCETIRLIGVTGAVVNRIDVTPSISGSPVLFNATGDADTTLAVFGTGTGGITLRNSGNTATIFGVQSVASGNYAPTMWASNESGTPGAAVIHRPSGQVAVAIGASSVTVTNDLVTATSVVIATLQFEDATFTQILSVVPGAGSFVITGNAVAAAPTKIGFIVINPSA